MSHIPAVDMKRDLRDFSLYCENRVYCTKYIYKESYSVLLFEDVFSLTLHVWESCVTSFFSKTLYSNVNNF